MGKRQEPGEERDGGRKRERDRQTSRGGGEGGQTDRDRRQTTRENSS